MPSFILVSSAIKLYHDKFCFDNKMIDNRIDLFDIYCIVWGGPGFWASPMRRKGVHGLRLVLSGGEEGGYAC